MECVIYIYIYNLHQQILLTVNEIIPYEIYFGSTFGNIIIRYFLYGMGCETYYFLCCDRRCKSINNLIWN